MMLHQNILFDRSETECYDQQEKSFLIDTVELLEAKNFQNLLKLPCWYI